MKAKIVSVRHYSIISGMNCENHYDVEYSTGTTRHCKLLSGAEYFPKSVDRFMDEHEARQLNSQVTEYSED